MRREFRRGEGDGAQWSKVMGDVGEGGVNRKTRNKIKKEEKKKKQNLNP